MEGTLNIKMHLGANPTIKPFSSFSGMETHTRTALEIRDQIMVQAMLKILSICKPVYSKI